MKRFYNSHSGMNKGTLYQLRCSINRKNVSGKVKEEMNQIQDFLRSVMKAHVLCAVLQFFGMEQKHSQPSCHKWPPYLSSNDEKWQFLSGKLGLIVDEYVMPCLSFKLLRQGSKVVEGDEGVKGYAMALLTDTLMAEELIDAVKEGDGDRLVRFWRFMQLYCSATGHTKYAFECFNFIAQISSTLTAREAHRLKWCRFANTRGTAGHNISGDLLMEHWNRTLKTHLCSVGANICSKTIVKTARAISALQHICTAYESTTAGMHQVTKNHSTKSSERDEQTLLDLLHTEKVFSSSNRSHSHFPLFKINLFTKINQKTFVERIGKNIKRYSRTQDLKKPGQSVELYEDLSKFEADIECVQNPLFL